MTQTALILGSSGSFGRNAAEAFEAAGWSVRRFRRGDDLTAAAKGADVIVNGWNPGYPRWAAELPGQTRDVIAAAKSSGATVLIAANVYPFGADAPEVLDETVPHRAANPLGRLRTEMEASFRASGVPVIVLRAGDFIDAQASGNWFDGIIAAKAGRGILTYPGDPDAVHAWAYLPDLARAAVALAEARTGLPRFADIPFPGYALTGHELAQAAARATGRPMALRRFAWSMVWAARPVWPLARGIWEMRYLWSKAHRLSGKTFRRLLPGFETTPVEVALAQALTEKVEMGKAA